MKICAISDMHGNYEFEIEPCDILLICGDIVPLYIQKLDTLSEDWLKTFFIPWCNKQPCEKVVFIAGNHDFLFMRYPEKVRDALKGQDKIVYLDCEIFEYKGKVIYGTPWCKPFYNWAFMSSHEEQWNVYKRHIDTIGKIDILMCHDCPYGIADVLLQKDCMWADGSHIGNVALREFVDKAKPLWCIQGHLHSTSHKVIKHNTTSVVCVSLLNEDYKMVYEPFYFEI